MYVIYYTYIYFHVFLFSGSCNQKSLTCLKCTRPNGNDLEVHSDYCMTFLLPVQFGVVRKSASCMKTSSTV